MQGGLGWVSFLQGGLGWVSSWVGAPLPDVAPLWHP